MYCIKYQQVVNYKLTFYLRSARIMDKVMIKRGLIMLGLIVIIIGVSFACDIIVNRDTSPTLTNPDAVFATVGDIEITNEDWYDVAKNADGITQLLNMVDELILSDTIDNVTQDEIDETLLELKYGTKNQEEIDALSAFELERALQNYDDLILISGFDPEDEASVERFVKLVIARENTVISQLNASSDITDDVLETYYTSTNKGELQAVVLRFHSLQEMNAILEMNNLVLGFEDGIGLYEGDTPIEDVASDEFTETNTRTLSDQEILTFFLEIYEYITPYQPSVPSFISISELAEFDLEMFGYDYTDMTEEGASAGSEAFANYLFDTLRASDNVYSTSSREIEANRILAFVLEDTDATFYEDLSAAELEANKEAYIESLLSQARLETEMAAYRESLGFEMYDTLLASQYEQGVQVDALGNSNNDSLIAVIDGNEIAVDDFFEYMANRVGALYALDLIRDQVLLESAIFEDLYGTDRDLFDNSSDAMVDFREQVRADKVNFSNGAYAQFGFSPDQYTWEEFLQAGYGFDSEYEYLLALSLGDVRSQYMIDQLNFDLMMTYVEDATENYLSLNVEQLLLYVDMDNDFEPDDFEEYFASLDEAEQASINAALANFEDIAEDAIDNDESLTDIVTAFNEALRSEDVEDDDYSEYARLKNLGFYILIEDLSAEESITYQSAKSYVVEFLDALIDFYQMYQEAENVDLDELLYDQVVRTQFGLHILLGTPGSDFEKPTGTFTASDLEAYVTYLAENRQLDEASIEADLIFEFGEEVYQALTAFYDPLDELFFGSNYFNGLFIEDVYADVDFTEDDSYHSEVLRTLGELFERRGLPLTREDLE